MTTTPNVAPLLPNLLTMTSVLASKLGGASASRGGMAHEIAGRFCAAGSDHFTFLLRGPCFIVLCPVSASRFLSVPILI